jgi:hypothetical protein
LFRFDVYGQRLIGLAPKLAQESDCLCILRGARVPFLVRRTPKSGKYMLVGEALAKNFMYGKVQILGFGVQEIVLV